MAKFRLDRYATYNGATVRLVSRVYLNGDWLYGIRLPDGRILDYVPSRFIEGAEVAA